MSKSIYKAVCPLLTVFALILCLALPAAAAEYYVTVDLATPSRIYNDDGTVTVTYDIPVDPYSIIFGELRDTDDWIDLGEQTNIYFTQSADESLDIYISLFDYSANMVSWHTYYEGYHGCEIFDSLPFEPSSVTHALIDGVVYECTVTSDSQDYYFHTDSGAINLSMRYYPEFYTQFVFPDSGFHSVSFGYMENVVNELREYDTIRAMMWPLGSTEADGWRMIDISDIKTGSNFEITFDFWDNVYVENYTDFDYEVYAVFLDADGNQVDYVTEDHSKHDVNGGPHFMERTMQFTVPDGAEYLFFGIDTGEIPVEDVTLFSLCFYDLELSVDISAVESNSQMLSGIQKTLDDISSGIGSANDKLDEIISGGAAGEDLIAGGDKIEDAGEGLGEAIGAIQDFESEYMEGLDNNLDDVISGADLTYLVAPLAFVQYYANKIVAGIPSQYLVIFTLPAMFGIFFYLVGHPIRAPKPDTSGDTVTRETFTETTILTGKHAGETRSTRTVTTSQEIGRVHNE